MRAFGSRPLASITTADISKFLAGLDADPAVTPRTVNKHRQILASIFKHATREDTFKLSSNLGGLRDVPTGAAHLCSILWAP
jgi:hypothetical protein